SPQIPGIPERIPNVRTVTPKASRGRLTFASPSFGSGHRGLQLKGCCPRLFCYSFTNRPWRSRPSDQIHRTAELQCVRVRRPLASVRETVLPSALDLAEPRSGWSGDWHTPSRAHVYRC